MARGAAHANPLIMTADRNGFIQERSPGAFTMRERLFAETRIRRVQDDARREVVVMRERRLARIVAGAVGIAGAALMVATLLRREGGHEAEPAWALAFAVLSAVLAYPAMRGGLRMARALTTEGPLAASSLAGLEPWSIALPLLATALLAPLTLHAVVWAVSVLATTDDTPLPMVVSKMSEWIFWSSIIVGHAHLALAVLVVKLARSIHRSTTEEVVALRAARRGWKHVAITTPWPPSRASCCWGCRRSSCS